MSFARYVFCTQAWQKARSDGWERSFCEKNFLSQATMEIIITMRTLLLGQLRAIGKCYFCLSIYTPNQDHKKYIKGR